MTRNRWTVAVALLGVGALVASLVGAGQVTPPAKAPPAPAVPPPLAFVVCNGVADSDVGLVSLFPAVPVPVPVVVKEVRVRDGDAVKAGDVILTLDDALAQAAVREAEAALAVARTKVAQAEAGRPIYEKGLAQQREAIRAKKLEVETAQLGLDPLKKLQSSNLARDTQVRALEKGIEARQAALRAEELKLEELKAHNPDDLLEEAAANVGLYEAKLAQAQAAAGRYALRAPSAGTVLRLVAEPGTVFGGQSRTPAAYFLPEGPLVVRADIDQEFVGQVRVGQACELQDETNPNLTWTGAVERLAKAYLPKRQAPLGDAVLTTDPARTLETVIKVTGGKTPLLVGQRVRVTIKQS